jgi:hypothetical protein
MVSNCTIICIIIIMADEFIPPTGDRAGPAAGSTETDPAMPALPAAGRAAVDPAVLISELPAEAWGSCGGKKLLLTIS